MSQQINLLLPELRPRFDWLALPVVVGASVVLLALALAFGITGSSKLAALHEREAALRSELAAVQQESMTLGKALGARQGDASLADKIELTKLEVGQRRQVLELLAGDGFGAGRGFSGVFRGFSRQIVPGVWLVGFAIAGPEIEIRGRLTDPALLPAYVGKLNDEAAFAGRRFATLEMKGVAAKTGSESVLPAFTEFALSTAATLSAEAKK